MHKLGRVNHNTYTQYRNHVTHIVRVAKANYYTNIFRNFKNDTKKIWQTINELSGRQASRTTVPTLTHKYVLHNNSDQIAEAFNEHFSETAMKLNNALPPANRDATVYLQGSYPNFMCVPPVNPIDVTKVIRTLKNKHSNIDQISITILKRNSEQIANPIALLFNQSISTGKFLAILKNANITPIHKFGPRNDPNNYRPISTLSNFSKIFEVLMKKKLMPYLEKNKILSDSQYGFRSGSSTYHALNLFSSHLYSSLDSKLSVLSIFIDV